MRRAMDPSTAGQPERSAGRFIRTPWRARTALCRHGTSPADRCIECRRLTVCVSLVACQADPPAPQNPGHRAHGRCPAPGAGGSARPRRQRLSRMTADVDPLVGRRRPQETRCPPCRPSSTRAPRSSRPARCRCASSWATSTRGWPRSPKAAASPPAPATPRAASCCRATAWRCCSTPTRRSWRSRRWPRWTCTATTRRAPASSPASAASAAWNA